MQTPTVRVVVRRLVGPRPAQAVVRCVADGLKAPVELRWKLAPSVRVVGGGVPAHEAALLVTFGEPVVAAAGAWAECTAAGADGKTARATTSLVAPRIASVTPARARAGAAHELVTVRGQGFAPVRGADDALYFVAGGAAVAANHACPGATWSEQAVSACVPAALPAGTWQLRLQAGDALALAPVPLLVTRGP